MNIEQLLNINITSSSRFTESSLTAANSVSIITHNDWAKRPARRTSDAFHHLPGLIVLPAPTGGNSVQVRGYGGDSVRGRATLFDGVPINSFVYSTDIFSVDNIELGVLERIELVRGPSSIIYGSDAFHSAVAYESWRPDSSEQEAEVSAGNDAYVHGSWRAGDAINEQWQIGWAMSGSREGDQHQSFAYRAPSGDEESSERRLEWESQTAVLHLINTPSERVQFNASLYYVNNDFDDFSGAGNAAFSTFDRDRGGHNGRLKMARMGSSHQLPWDLELESRLYYWDMKHGQEFEAPAPPDTIIERTHFEENRFGTAFILRQDSEAIATRLSLEASYEQAEVDNNRLTRTSKNTGAVTELTPVDYSGTNQSIRGLSLDANTQLSEQWRAIWGGRYDDYDTFGGTFNPRLGFTYRPSEHRAIKLVYSEAFRAPAAVELRGTTLVQGAPDLDPETLQNLELSLIHEAKQWQMAWAVFRNHWKDRIVIMPFNQNGFTTKYMNSGEYRSTGTEVNVKGHLDQWLFEGGASYVYSENRDSDDWISVFPKIILNLGVGYSWPDKQIELFVHNRYHDKVYYGDPNLPPNDAEEAPAYFRTDLTLRQNHGEHWQVGLELRNIFNRDNVLPSLVNSYKGIPDIDFDAAINIEYRM